MRASAAGAGVGVCRKGWGGRNEGRKTKPFHGLVYALARSDEAEEGVKDETISEPCYALACGWRGAREREGGRMEGKMLEDGEGRGRRERHSEREKGRDKKGGRKICKRRERGRERWR